MKKKNKFRRKTGGKPPARSGAPGHPRRIDLRQPAMFNAFFSKDKRLLRSLTEALISGPEDKTAEPLKSGDKGGEDWMKSAMRKLGVKSEAQLLEKLRRKLLYEDQEPDISPAERKRIQEDQREIMLSLFKENLDPYLIAKATGLPETEVIKIKSKIESGEAG